MKYLLNSDQVRDLVHNLDLENSKQNEIFWNVTKRVLIQHEGLRLKVYDDSAGNATIGVGFNMNSRSAREEWKKILGSEVSFEDAKSGKINLTEKQAHELLDQSLKSRYSKLSTSYGINIWQKLRANEKMAILSSYFNVETIVNQTTEFQKNILKYVETGDKKYLSKSVLELRENSNPLPRGTAGQVGIQNRRNFDSTLLESYKSPFYTSPIDNLFPRNMPKIVLGKTIIPIGLSEYLSSPGNSNYFIWRTKEDTKVRASHSKRNGLVYHYDSKDDKPGSDYNCRCWSEPFPIKLEVIDPTNDTKQKQTLLHFIRYGNASNLFTI